MAPNELKGCARRAHWESKEAEGGAQRGSKLMCCAGFVGSHVMASNIKRLPREVGPRRCWERVPKEPRGAQRVHGVRKAAYERA
jgi:hypothetical protein